MSRVPAILATDSVLGFDTASDLYLQAALWGGAGMLLLVLVMAVAVLCLRLLWQSRQRRDERIRSTWRPVLAVALEGHTDTCPPLSHADTLSFLRFWNGLHDVIRGDAGEYLNRIARKLGMEDAALRLLHTGGTHERLIACKTLGYLRCEHAWDTLAQLMDVPDAMLSFAAARTRVEINANRALPSLMPLIASRDDWPTTQVTEILRKAGSEASAKRLARAAVRARSTEERVRLMRYLVWVQGDLVLPQLRDIVRNSCEDEVILAGLPALRQQEDIAQVRELSHHPNWRIRTLAARSLGRIGMPEDEPLLIRLLTDKHWWVRTRASEALAGLPFMDVQRLREIQTQQIDDYAYDSLARYTGVRRREQTLSSTSEVEKSI